MATNYFLNQYFTTTLNVGGGIDASQTTGIIVQAVSGLDITKPGVACITYADPINTSTAEWVTYTSIDGSNELQGVTRGAEGFGAKTHSNGAVIAFPLSESHINTLATALSIGGVATNGVTTTLDEDDMASNSATALATQQSIKAYVDSGTVTMTNKTLTSPTINNGVFTGGGALSSKMVGFTRDISAANGDVAITSVGFTPTSIIFIAAVGGSSAVSTGFVDSAKGMGYTAMYQADTYAINSTACISIAPNAINYANAVLKTFDANGFTLTWTKTGSPTGTASVYALCFR